jgi:putative hydrolase of the HAD superfamily
VNARPTLAAVLFDFGGTLDAAGIPWKDRVFRLYRAEGVAVSPEQFDPVFYGADDALVGTIGETRSFRETVHRLVSGVSAALGVDAERTDRIATRFLESACASVSQNAVLLSRLAGRYQLGLVSNFYGNLATVCDDVGIRALFSVIVDSTCVGWRKPDRRIFEHALRSVGVAPANATFVGDSPSRDMHGARDVGMAHIWLAGEEPQRRAPCCPGDRVVSSLAELGGLLL